MIAAMRRDRVYGFLDTKGTKLVNGRGEEVLLTGWGLGNWLLPEGYMWLAGGRMDRPRGIEQVIREVAGVDYAKGYWKKFRKKQKEGKIPSFLLFFKEMFLFNFFLFTFVLYNTVI